MGLGIAGLALALAAAACAQHGADPAGGLAALEAECRPLYADPRLDPLRDKLALDGAAGDVPSGAAALPDEREIEALAAFAERRAECVQQVAARLRATRPELMPAYRTAVARRTLTFAKLYGGTIGFATARAELEEADRLFRQEAAAGPF